MIIRVTKAELVDFILRMDNYPVNMSENEYHPDWYVCGCLFVQYVLYRNWETKQYSCSAGDDYCVVYDIESDREIARYEFECNFSYFGIPETFDGFKV